MPIRHNLRTIVARARWGWRWALVYAGDQCISNGRCRTQAEARASVAEAKRELRDGFDIRRDHASNNHSRC